MKVTCLSLGSEGGTATVKTIFAMLFSCLPSEHAQICSKMAARVSVVFLLVFLSIARALPRSGILLSPPLPPGTAVADPMWFKAQKLDQFSDKDTRTWSQRYFVNDSLWEKEGGPVFLMLGGEGPADPAWLATNTDIMRNAAKFKAIVFLLEHRCVQHSAL